MTRSHPICRRRCRFSNCKSARANRIERIAHQLAEREPELSAGLIFEAGALRRMLGAGE